MDMSAKDLGTLAELKFSLEAYKQGFNISHPINENNKYDVILEKDGFFSRVQIKSCNVPIAKEGSFKFSIGYGDSSKSAYTSDQIDHIACYPSQLNVFYIIPVILLEELKTIRIYPFREKARYNEFKDNWSIFDLN